MRIGGAIGGGLVMLALGALRCGGAPVDSKQGDQPPAQVVVTPGIARSDPGPSVELTFPPQRDDRRERPPLPDRFMPPEKRPLALAYPDLSTPAQASGGKTVRFAFNQPMVGARAQAAAGTHLRMSYTDPQPGDPPIVGLASWESDRDLVFTASGFLDPERKYRAELSDLESVSGERLAGPLVIDVRSNTGAIIAGKEIGHRPVAGRPRPIASSHGGQDGLVSTLPRLRLLYDQPIHLDLARTLITLRDAQSRVIPVSVWRAADDSWQGVRVDRKLVVDVTPKQLLERGHTYHLVALEGGSDDPQQHEEVVQVAEPLAFLDVECGWWLRDEDLCHYQAGGFGPATLRTNQRELHLRFNNRIAADSKKLRAYVKVTPAVRNLVISNEGWGEGRLVLHGDFRPSTHYRVRVAALPDVFGQRLATPVQVDVDTSSLGASISMPEGLVLLDEAHTEKFTVHSRNVSEAEMWLWQIDEGDVRGFKQALARASAGQPADRSPDHRLIVPIASQRDEIVATEVDLRRVTGGDASFLATIRPRTYAYAAVAATQPADSPASRPPVALIKPGRADSLAIHTHTVGGTAVVQVARLVGGTPVSGAKVSLDDDSAEVTTNVHGVALLSGARSQGDGIVRVEVGGHRMLFPLASLSVSSSDLFPELAFGHDGSSALRGFIVSDRGIYRPGATLGMKASVFRVDGAKLRPAAAEQLSVQVIGPTGDIVCSAKGSTTAMGSLSSECALPASSKVGLHRIVAESASGGSIATEMVRVADFEPPRFKVDVDLTPPPSGGGKLRGQVRARYLFGAAMQAAWTRWTVTRQPAPVAAGTLGEAGLVFRASPSWFEDDADDERQSWTGESALTDDGTLNVEQVADLGQARGPQRFTLEADVSDASYRHVASRQSVVVHPAARYAGLAGPRGWVGVGEQVEAKLGVVDTEGEAVVGATVTARLMSVSWRWIERLGPGGSLHTEWRRSEREVGRCGVVSEARPVDCKIRVPGSGDYQLVASVDGRPGGATWFWAWREGSQEQQTSPSRGNVVQIASDQASYRPGDTAKLLVRSPYPAATALVTTEMGTLVRHQEQRIDGAAGVVQIPIEASYAPHVHATVTLLPIGAPGDAAVSYRVGAIRLPVTLKGTSLDVKVASDKPRYGPGDEVEVTVQVSDGGAPEARAEVALAVVDEGVLRLTDFHASDPVAALRPPMALNFTVADSRAILSDLFARSHVAGDGGGDEVGSLPNTRRKFVQTALWKPALSTDASGQARVRFRLPDNLTEFRMMAVVVDDEGKGGRSESSFEVNKPLLVEPLLPRFAHVGDRFELAAMVHNTTDAVFEGTATIAGRELPLRIEAGGRERLAVERSPRQPGREKVTMEVRDLDGKTLDRVERPLTIAQPGVDARPGISGAFKGRQAVALRIPEEALFDEDAVVSLRVGEHMWPEIGERLEYLLGYPHGCVEQTTSSTLPLLAAREIFPRIGIDKHGEAFYRERIVAGLKRLDSMRTPGGGLAYWPGATEPNVYGTAYAMRAVVRARQAGIPLPTGLEEGMVRYLSSKVLLEATDPDVRAAIAQSLAEVDAFPVGIADALFELRQSMDLFGKASLAIALGALPEQRDRVATLLDEIEGALSSKGRTRVQHDGYHDWGSPRRTEAQAAMALSRLRRGSVELPRLVREIAEQAGGYTTQATAYGLLALADHLTTQPTDGAPLTVSVDGVALEPAAQAQGGGREYRLPLKALAGRKARLLIESGSSAAFGFAMSAAYRMPIATTGGEDGQISATLPAASASNGADVYRVLTTAAGDPVDPSRIRAGELLRVALLVRFPEGGRERPSYLAITDRLPAGFEPVEPDLSSVASPPDLGAQHPFADLLGRGYDRANYVELRDDRVQIYFDRLWGREVAASYLVRATTPGTFAQPPAAAELMYDADSTSYCESGKVTIL